MTDKTKEIAIPRKIVQKLLHHAQQTPKLEVCGLISSRNNIPFRSYPIENTAAQPEGFFNLDASQQIQAMAQMRENNEQLFAIYHSHPTAPAIPSSTDIAQATYPEALAIIITLKTKGVLELRAYQIADSQFIEVPLCLD
ncbi:Mov34/MPN/PAD-1 family protein [Methyloprofundus sp.]|uniref:Mov34/MPN/PAD-1 family protein n=1 Tax=Methyloprofundus sp. TaxID=2020875 RepID=UPI003D0A615D